jgi:hypothetical protein
MTSLEKFLVKRQTGKTIENPKETQKGIPAASQDLLNATAGLKAIFPHDSDENIMLLALQFPNQLELEEEVNKILSNNWTLKQVTENWNTVKPRDKKKPEQKKKKNNKKEYSEENNYNEYKEYKAQSKVYYDSRSGKNYGNTNYKPKQAEFYDKNKPRVENNKTQVFEENKIIEEEKKTLVEVEKNEPVVEKQVKFDDFPGIKEENYTVDAVPSQNYFENIDPKPAPVLEYAEPPSYINISQEEVIIPRELPQAPNEEPVPIVKKSSENSSVLSQTTLKKDFGVQVNIEIEYGIPIIIYPYMFQRNN